MDFDLVVTVCDSAKETCPVFPKAVTKIHIGFSEFLPKIKEKLN